MEANLTLRKPRLGPLNCNSCFGPCIYKAVELLFVFGIIANFLVFTLVLKDKKLRSPTYVAIACLALSDALFVISNIIGAVEIVVRSLTCTFPLAYDGPVVATVKGICWFSAQAHVSVLAFVRYLLLLYPFKAREYVTTRNVLLSSALVWTLGIVLWTTVLVLSETKVVKPAHSVLFLNIIWIIVYLTPLLVTIFLHCRKWRHVRKMSQVNLSRTGSLLKSSMRMTKIILIVIMLAIFLPLPMFIYETMSRIQYSFPSTAVSTTLRDVSALLFMLNHSINPFIYAFMSPPFQRSLKSMFCRN